MDHLRTRRAKSPAQRLQNVFIAGSSAPRLAPQVLLCLPRALLHSSRPLTFMTVSSSHAQRACYPSGWSSPWMSSQHRQRVRRCGEGLAEGRLRVLALSRFVHRHLHAVRVCDVGRCERPSRQPAGKRSRAGARGAAYSGAARAGTSSTTAPPSASPPRPPPSTASPPRARSGHRRAGCAPSWRS